MDEREGKRLHDTLGFVGLRAQATAVGLLQLSIELIKAGVLDEAAVTRIKQAIFNDIALSRPSSLEKRDYEATLHRRLDDLFTAETAPPTTPPAAASR